MYRDHRKGPGGPPGGATYPEGPHGLKGRGNKPLVGWCAPLGPPMRLGVGAPLLGLEAKPPLGLPPPSLDGIYKGPVPPRPLYIVEGREGSRT